MTGAAVLLAMTLVECRPVVDNVLGVKYGAQPARGAGDCISTCARAYGDSMKVESDLHVTNVKACASDSVCLALEDIRFEAAVARIRTGRQNCQNNCHHQGGGQGGR
ncbi:MAG: hypothetical protein HYR73_05240 [Candidatus Eisenbacteria bacterium]|nr:hypothetical protein [Candidatus Eisenbacteria bacterium]